MNEMASSQLHEIIDQCRKDRHYLTYEKLKERYNDLYTTYPKLFDYIAFENDYDYDVMLLSYMLSQREKLRTREQDLLHVNMNVSDKLAQTYLYTDETRPDESITQASKTKLEKYYSSS